MKALQKYVFIMAALIAMLGFTSCETDEEKGFDISGLYGKTWYGDLGFSDGYGVPLYSYITFSSGASASYGVGTDEQCYYDDSLYRTYKFDWVINGGWLYITYSDGYELAIWNPTVSGHYFYGTVDQDGFDFRLQLVSGRSVSQ